MEHVQSMATSLPLSLVVVLEKLAAHLHMIVDADLRVLSVWTYRMHEADKSHIRTYVRTYKQPKMKT